MRFTTDVIDDEHKAEFWRNFVCDHIADLDCQIDDKHRFNGEITSYPLGNSSLSIIKGTAHRVFRKQDRITKTVNDYFVLIYQMRGSARFEQNGIVSHLSKGDCVLYDPQQPYDMELLETFEHITLRVAREYLALLDTDITPHLGKKVDANSLNGGVVSAVVSNVISRVSQSQLPVVNAFIDASIPLIAEALIDEHGINRQSVDRSNRRTLASAKSFIIENIDRFELSVGMVAQELGISPRHLNRLFKQEDISPAKWIKAMRLERSASALVNPVYQELNISQIAFRNGFGDFSHFCRDFKARFSLSPGDYRSRYLR